MFDVGKVLTDKDLQGEKNMNIFDIMGPVMVGPSSSHTAGAVKIGYISRRLLGESVTSAKILISNEAINTSEYRGHDWRKTLQNQCSPFGVSCS